MTTAANQYGYWQTGNFANDFKAPAQQAPISQDRNTGREGYGYQYYSPGKWGRDGWNKWAFSAPCLFSINTPTTIFVVDNGNTVVHDDSNNTWRITKDTGAGTAYNASAVSTGYFAGDFAVSGTRLVTTNNIFFGVNSDPLTDNDYASIDYAFDYDVTNAKWYIYESGVYTGIGSLDDVGATLHPYVWRTGTTLGYGVAATLAAAQASPARTVAGVTGNLYFDSSLLGPDTVFQVALSGTATVINAYSLVANVGVYALTGTATGLAVQRRLAEAVGTYSITGTPTALRIARRQVEAVGSYAITGTPTGLVATRKLAGAVGSYALTGTATGLRKGYNQAEAVGSYSISGVATALRIARRQVEAVGSYAITGTATGLRVTLPVPVGSYAISGQTVTFGVAMPSAVGSYAISGVATALRIARRLIEAVGSYIVSGQSVTLTYGAASKVLTAAVGSYALGGVSASLVASRRLTEAIGSYTLSGTAVDLRVALPVSPGSYAIAGQSLIFRVSVPVAAGSYVVSGTAVGLKATRRLTAAIGSYSITGIGPVLGAVMPVVSGSYSIAGVAVSLRRAVRLPVLVGAYALTGLASFLSATRSLAASQGAYVITGTSALLRISKGLGAVPGSYVITGQDVDLRTNDVVLSIVSGAYVLTGTALGFVKTVAVPPSRIVAPSSVSRLVQPPTRELVAQAAMVGRVVSPSRRLA